MAIKNSHHKLLVRLIIRMHTPTRGEKEDHQDQEEKKERKKERKREKAVHVDSRPKSYMTETYPLTKANSYTNGSSKHVEED